MVERSSQQSKSQSNKRAQNQSQSSQNTIASPQIDVDNLTPENVIHLQRQLGNQYVLNLMQRKKDPNAVKSASTPAFPRIQRTGGTRNVHDQEHTIDDPGINDTVGLVGDWMGTNPNEGLSITGSDNGTGDAGTGMDLGTAGSVISVLTGTVGTGMGTYNLVRNIQMHKQANTALKQYNTDYKDDSMPGHEELYATVNLLKRKRNDAVKGEFESAGSIIGGISGLVNGISGFISGATAALVAGVAFGVGAGLNALIGTIAAIRDFVSAGKRHKTKKEIGQVRAGYVELYNGLSEKMVTLNDKNLNDQGILDGKTNEIRDLLQEINGKTGDIVVSNQRIEELKDEYKKEQGLSKRQTLIADIMLEKQKINRLTQEKDALAQTAVEKEDEAQEIGDRITETADKIQDAEAKYDEYGKIITALTTAERKQGYGGKIGTGIVNLAGAAGGAALLFATLGAGAAAGPVGWVLSGIALVGILGYTIGMAIKRSIRKSNVKRMKQEITLVANYITNGALPAGGTLPDNYTRGGDEGARRNNIWHRQMFPTDEKKGWFNKLISKKRSGKMTMQERIDLITKYLSKYDTETQADVIVEGFIKALQPGDEGDQEVANPAYSDDLKPEIKANTPQTITLRDLNKSLLTHFFKDKADDMSSSLRSTDPDRSKDARDLLAQKLKLGG